MERVDPTRARLLRKTREREGRKLYKLNGTTFDSTGKRPPQQNQNAKKWIHTRLTDGTITCYIENMQMRKQKTMYVSE
jgi:hypothetical protein